MLCDDDDDDDESLRCRIDTFRISLFAFKGDYNENEIGLAFGDLELFFFV